MSTASAITQYHAPLSAKPCTELREWNLGELEGLSFSVLYEKYSDIMESFKREDEDTRIPGGESQKEFQARLDGFFDSLAAEHQGKRILIVTHGGALQRIFRHAVGPTESNNYLSLSGNTSVNIFRNIAGRWQLVTWNDCSNLKDIGQKATIGY